MDSTFAMLMHQGGPVMWVLLAFSVLIVANVIQRTLVLKRAGGDAAPLLRRIHAVIKRGGSREKAAAACAASTGSVARFLEGALRYKARDMERFERHLEASALLEIRRLNRGLTILVAASVSAPILGFLGTVTGMMVSFEAIADKGLSDPAAVALGIKEALTTTAAGLAVALPAQLCYQALSARVRHLEAELETAANALIELLDPA